MASTESKNSVSDQPISAELDDPWLTSCSSDSHLSDSSDSSLSSDLDSDESDSERMKDLAMHPELTINVEIDDQSRAEEAGPLPCFKLKCGTGRNTFKWLAMVAMQRYSQLCKLHGRTRSREAFHTDPGQFIAIKISKRKSVSGDKIDTEDSLVLQGIRRRSMQRQQQRSSTLHLVQQAMNSASLEINPRSSLREQLVDGDTVVVTVNTDGTAPRCHDGRFYGNVQREGSLTAFEAASYHTSSAGVQRYEKFREGVLKQQQKLRQERIKEAATILFGEANASALNKLDLTEEAAQREHLLKSMFQMDWSSLDLHGLLKRSDRPLVRNVLKEHYGVIVKVFDHFSTIGIDFVFRSITHSLTEDLHAERATIWIVDNEKGELWTKAATGQSDGDQIRVPFGKGIVGECVARGVLINIPDAYKDSRFNSDVDKLTGFRTRQILCVPAKDPMSHRVLGALQVINRKCADDLGGEMKDSDLPFSRVDERDLQHIAERFAREMRNIRHHETITGGDSLSSETSHPASTSISKSVRRSQLNHTEEENLIDGGRTGGMSMPEYHKMLEAFSILNLEKQGLSEQFLDKIFESVIEQRELRMRHNSGMRRKSRQTGLSSSTIMHPDSLDRQSFMLLLIAISNKLYHGKYPKDPAKRLLELMKTHILPQSQHFAPTDIKAVMLEEENAQVLVENVGTLKTLFIRFRGRALKVVSRKSFLEMCKLMEYHRFHLRIDDIVRIFKVSGSDLGGAQSLGGREQLSFPQFVTAIARIAEELVLDNNPTATMSERLHYLCEILQSIAKRQKNWSKVKKFSRRLRQTTSLLKAARLKK